jgi:hypothetical protein
MPRELAWGKANFGAVFLSISLSDIVGTKFCCLILETAKDIRFPGNLKKETHSCCHGLETDMRPQFF